MFKGRGLLTLIVLALILLIAYLLIRQGNFNLPGKKPTELPVDLKKDHSRKLDAARQPIATLRLRRRQGGRVAATL